MPLPPPRQPRPAPEPEPEPNHGQEPEVDDPQERRRRLREQALRGMRSGTPAMQPVPAPVQGGALPPMPAKKWPWWSYALLFPLILVVLGLMLFTLMVDPTTIPISGDTNKSAILHFAKVSPPPEGAKNLFIMGPSETVNHKYSMTFEATEPEINEWIRSSPGLQGVVPKKQPMQEFYTLPSDPKNQDSRNALVTVNRMVRTVVVEVDAYKELPKETVTEYVERKRREEGKVAGQAPASTAGATSGAATADPEAEARKQREEEVMKILQRGSQSAAPAAEPESTAPRPKIIGEGGLPEAALPQ